MASILVIGPHPDDEELGMGGSIIRLVSQGHRVHIVDMTNGEPTPFGSVEMRARESKAVACYESQFKSNAAGNVPEMVRTLNGYFGGRIGTAYAEPFFTYEVLGFSGLDQLI